MSDDQMELALWHLPAGSVVGTRDGRKWMKGSNGQFSLMSGTGVPQLVASGVVSINGSVVRKEERP